MSVQKINPDTYVGDTGKQLKDIKTNADNISNHTTKLNEFDNKNLSSTGYQKITGGMLIQWGQTNITVEANVHEKYIDIVYPKQFSSVYQVVCCLNDVGYGVQGLDAGISATSLTTSNFRATYKDASRYNLARTVLIRWIAIGKI